MRDRRPRYVLPIGQSWKDETIDERLVADYRFDPSRFARLRLALDMVAVAYLGCAAILLALDVELTHGGPTLGIIADSFLLRALIPRLSPLVFLLVAIGVLVHECALGETPHLLRCALDRSGV